jgi:integrase
LKRRREPYWVPIVRGCALGYRKGANGGSWIARVRKSDSGQEYHALGAADDLNDGQGLSYEAALERARRFFGVAAGASGRWTVAHALDAYLENLKAHNPATTIADAEARINSILKPALGSIPLVKLASEAINRWKNDTAKTRKPETVNRLLAILKAALNNAWRERHIADDSPWRQIKRLEGGSARKVFLSLGQCRTLLKHCTPDAFRRLVQAALVTGARYGELVVLKVQDFDPNTGTLEIRDGKTGERVVYLSEEAIQVFLDCCEGKSADALILRREDGHSWGKNHHQRMMQAAVKAAKLPRDTVFYSLRHTHISLALLAGVNIQVLAENCGTSVRMIEKHYGKFLRQDRRAMFDRMTGFAA